MKINIKKLSEDALIPTTGSLYSAGYDLYSCNTVTIEAHNTVLIHTGIAMEIPEGFFGAVFARSGMATKKALRPANCVGVIDADYRGEIMVPLHNDSELPRAVEKGERIAQMIILQFNAVEFNEVEELNETERADRGFGSTGK